VLADPCELDDAIRALKRFQQDCSEEIRHGLEPLLQAWQAQRLLQRDEALRYLQGPRHAHWLEMLQHFIQTDEYDRALQVGRPYYLRHAIDEILASHIARVRAYDTLPASPHGEDLHALRLAIKRLRDVTGALREVLPPARAEQIITACVAAQDSLGIIRDARLMAGRAMSFMAALHVRTLSDRAPSARPTVPDALVARSVLAFAEAQQRVSEQQLSVWRQTLNTFLVL
jgi:CHAD domain-containing protein